MGTTVLTPKTTHVEFDIPADLVGKELEIIYREINTKETSELKMGDFWGILSDESADAIRDEIKKIREEWD